MTRIVRHDARGPALIQTSDGIIAICQCGLSESKPFCDGSHRKTQNESEGLVYLYDKEGQRVSLEDMFPPATKKFDFPAKK
jgi:CDGSH-type Zn-finger protein